MNVRRWGFALATSAGLLGAAAVGCGGGKPSVSGSTDEATVKGKVTIKGKTATKGTVVFDPANYKRKDVSARSAPIGEDGTYSIQTLVGINSVRVSGPQAEKAGAAYVNLDLDVQQGDNTFDIVLPPPPSTK
jgi:hypothetical protein